MYKCGCKHLKYKTNLLFYRMVKTSNPPEPPTEPTKPSGPKENTLTKAQSSRAFTAIAAMLMQKGVFPSPRM